MYSAETLSRLLSGLYSAAANPLQWPEFLESLCRECGARGGFIVAVDQKGLPALYADVGFDNSFRLAYQALFRGYDIVLQRFLEAGGRPGGWIGARDSLISDHELEKSLFYNEFMRPRDIYHQAGINLGITGNYLHAGISLLREKSRKEFPSETIALLEILAAHFERGFHLHQKLSGLRGKNAVLASDVEATGIALLRLDRAGLAISWTLAALELTRQSDGLLMRNGRLQAEIPAEDSALQRLITSACRIGSGNANPLDAVPNGIAMLVSRRPPRRPLQVVVTPFYSDNYQEGTTPCAVVFIAEPHAGHPRGELLRALYGLTPSEARLADWLMHGLDVKQAAQRMCNTENSARFLLKSIFKKTGVSSQSALMRLMAGLPPLSGRQSRNLSF